MPNFRKQASSDQSDQVRVLYVGGAGRSGSTLLGLMLGRLPGLSFHGELRWLWRSATALDELCGCGEPFARCPFWRQVGANAFGGWNDSDLEQIVEDEERVVRWRYMPALPTGSLPRAHLRAAHCHYAKATSDLYRATRDAAGSSIVVDSSKDPPFAFFLAGLPGIDLRVVQLVRDSRAVVHSLGRQVRRPDVADRAEYLPRYSPAAAALRWDVWNGCFDALRMFRVPVLRERYEDLVESPESTLRRIAAFVEAPIGSDELGWLAGHAFDAGDHHTVAGNPIGFRAGQIEIQPDDEWRTALSRRDRLKIEAVTLPLLAPYGYRRSGQRTSRRS